MLWRKAIDERLRGILRVCRYPRDLVEVIEYSLFPSGKRLRPILFLAWHDTVCPPTDAAVSFACGIELYHTFTLIHDDMPCLDNDDFRRGKPSNHKAYGEGQAILAGDALLNEAYRLCFSECYKGKSYIDAAVLICENAGVAGMIAGQSADLYEQGRNEDIFCAIRRRQRKQFKRNKKEYDKLSEHIGLLPLVMVSPADSDLIRGGSDERRRFLDLIISQQDKQYLHALIQYNKALLQRNILLKNQNTDTSLYEVLEMQLDMYGRMVFEKRQLLVESFIPIFNEYYQTICRSTEQVGLGYISQLADRNLAESLAANRERDRILGYTSNGVHKDELEMTLNEQLIRRAGSQGQNKTYLIALKLAQFAFLTRKGQTTPILLLDDIFDKLDAARVAEIIKLVSGDSFGQIFITDTNRKYLDEILQAMNHDYALFRVEQGEVQPMEDQP